MKPVKKLTAAERTISLFTGKTLADDPNARDGTPSELPRLTRGGKAIRWDVDAGDWVCRELDARIRVDGGHYNVLIHGRRVGSFDNIHDAANAAERRS